MKRFGAVSFPIRIEDFVGTDPDGMGILKGL